MSNNKVLNLLMNSPLEIIQGKLYWLSNQSPPRYRPKSFFICTDSELEYSAFNQDFGPLNLAMVYRFSMQLSKILKDPGYQDHQFYYYTSLDPGKRANSAFLICAFQMLILGRSSSEAWEPFARSCRFQAFRDASIGESMYDLTILKCLEGLERAMHLKWFDCRSFDCLNYEHLEQVENGDCNWVIPNKILAFSAPTSMPILDYVRLFKDNKIKAVIRLNEKTYNENAFTQHGIQVYDLSFLDGSCPSLGIVNQFISIVENHGTVAVHCKAGLGRTGTLIGCYAWAKYKFPGEQFIAWCRICRPGSILGPQQQYLVDYSNSKIPHKWNKRQKEVAQFGENGQGNALFTAKQLNQSMHLRTFSSATYDERRTHVETNVTKVPTQRRPLTGLNRSNTPKKIAKY